MEIRTRLADKTSGASTGTNMPKGSLVGLDLSSGNCELTILTNKFGIANWEQYFPPLRQFQLSGEIKVLTSLKGNYITGKTRN